VSGYPVRFLDALPQNEPNLHAVDFYMRQVGGPHGAVPQIACPRTDEGFIAVHPFSGSPKKNWVRFDEFAELAPLPVRVCVSPEQQWSGAVQFGDLYDLARWLATATLYVGNDSGISHLAAAVGVPTIAIFRASDPRIWAPRGRAGVTVLESPTLDEVLATARSQLRSR
jgi:heptosyltransferase III